MRRFIARGALALLAVASAFSCSDSPLSPLSPVQPAPGPPLALASASAAPALVISQVYGGGGNSGAPYKNDFIELFNPGGQPVSVDGWSVQYASAAGTTWQVTALAGTIQPGAYYLVREGAGTGVAPELPTLDAGGGIAMSATAGKVALSATTTPLTGACPAAVNLVGFGTAASDCGAGRTPTLSNTTAALRLDAGCKTTGDHSADFATGAPAPRNGATPVHLCPGLLPVGPLHHVLVAGPATVVAGSSIQLAATPQDSSNQAVGAATVTWSSSDESIATVSAQGLVTGVAVSAAPVTITATAVKDDATKSGSTRVAVTAPSIAWIDVSSSATSFPPGFQTQLFATARTGSGGTIVPATFTFESENPEVAAITGVANSGLITAVAASTSKPGFRITATPIGGGTPYSFSSHPITVETPVSAPTSIYGDNDEFGDPTPASASNLDDLLIERPQYTLSYNATRGTPNWVSYELDARQMVSGQDRCNCFTADPKLPADKRILTSDYTSGGYDRGHMARSADRTVANVDNASTFYLTNIVPQMGDLNQGVWAQFENALADSARAGRAVYIVTGPLYSRSHALTFLKGEGKVAIPDSTWKVAFIGPRTSDAPFTRSTTGSWDDLAGTTVLAVNMPNVAGVRNDPWSKYLTTVDRVEASTGYDILSLLPTAFQQALEAGDRGPTARFALTGTASEGSAMSFDASSSSDPDLGRADLDRPDALTYQWRFSDGSSASGRVASHTFTHYGTFTATLTVTDAYGWPSETAQTVTIANVPPTIAPFDGATILRGETYSTSGSFGDPGLNAWSATVDYGDGGGAQPLALGARSFALRHAYAKAGTFTVTVTLSDGEAATTRSASVVVESAVQGIGHLSEAIGGLTSFLNRGQINALQAMLRNASAFLGRGDPISAPAANVLHAFVNALEATIRSGRLPDALVSVVHYAQRVIVSIGG